jgi:hypothetical protein
MCDQDVATRDMGAQFAARDKYFAGVVYRSGTKVDVDYSNAAGYEDTHTARKTSARYSGRGALALPSSVGLGVAVRPVPQLTLAVDHSLVFWSGATLDGYTRTNLGGVPQAVRLAYPTQTAADLKAQSDTGRSSAGAEYILNAGRIRIPLRAGLAYQQAYDNAPGNSVAMSAGGGVRWGGFFLDAAWVRDTASGRYTRQSLTRRSVGVLKGTRGRDAEPVANRDAGAATAVGVGCSSRRHRRRRRCPRAWF